MCTWPVCSWGRSATSAAGCRRRRAARAPAVITGVVQRRPGRRGPWPTTALTSPLGVGSPGAKLERRARRRTSARRRRARPAARRAPRRRPAARTAVRAGNGVVPPAHADGAQAAAPGAAACSGGGAGRDRRHGPDASRKAGLASVSCRARTREAPARRASSAPAPSVWLTVPRRDRRRPGCTPGPRARGARRRCAPRRVVAEQRADAHLQATAPRTSSGQRASSPPSRTPAARSGWANQDASQAVRAHGWRSRPGKPGVDAGEGHLEQYPAGAPRALGHELQLVRAQPRRRLPRWISPAGVRRQPDALAVQRGPAAPRCAPGDRGHVEREATVWPRCGVTVASRTPAAIRALGG
jgi:hypothetical protein